MMAPTRTEITLLLALMAGLWALMPITQMWDWDEPLYARTGIEMFAAGNLLLPRFNGEIFAHKPPLGYWMMGLSAQIFGQTEFAARFFSAPMMAIAAFFTGRTAALMFGARVGEMTMVVFATSLMAIYLGAAAMMDAPLIAGYAICVWVAVKITVERAMSFYLLAVFSVGMLVTLLIKGPVGPVLIGAMVLALYLFLPKPQELPFWSLAALFMAGCVALTGFLLWFIPANSASGGALINEGIGIHIIGRALAPMEGHGGNGILGFLIFLPIYIPVIFVGMLPWSLAAPAAIKAVFSEMNARDRIILLAWFLPTFLAFSIAATKLPHYIFPALAPMSAAIGYFIAEQRAEKLAVGRILAAIAYLALAAVMAYLLLTFSTLSALKLGLACALFVAMAVFVYRLAIFDKSHVTLAALSWMLTASFYNLGLTEVDNLTKLSKTIGAAIQTHAPPGAFVMQGSFAEPSLVFYARRPFDNPVSRGNPDQMLALIDENEVGYAVVTQEEFDLITRARPDLIRETLAKAAAYNLNQNSQYQSVYLLRWGKK